MKVWIKYLIIFAIIGFVLGYFIGLISYVAPECNPGEPCMGQPDIYAWPGAIIGTILGATAGLIIGKIKSKKK